MKKLRKYRELRTFTILEILRWECDLMKDEYLNDLPKIKLYRYKLLKKLASYQRQKDNTLENLKNLDPRYFLYLSARTEKDEKEDENDWIEKYRNVAEYVIKKNLYDIKEELELVKNHIMNLEIEQSH